MCRLSCIEAPVTVALQFGYGHASDFEVRGKGLCVELRGIGGVSVGYAYVEGVFRVVGGVFRHFDGEGVIVCNRADALSYVVSPLRGSVFVVIVCNRADALFYDISPLQGYILDGVPRTIPQAEAMEKLGINIDTALSIEVDDDVIVKRMSGRRTCRKCGASFHTVHNPPKVDGICDNCGTELSIRTDDAPETVRARLANYHRETEPLKNFYAERGKLKAIENQPSIDETTVEIRRILGI